MINLLSKYVLCVFLSICLSIYCFIVSAIISSIKILKTTTQIKCIEFIPLIGVFILKDILA